MWTGLEMHEACTVGDFDSLEEYLKSGKYDVNMPDPEWQDRTPLHWACAKGYVECIRLLLEHGAKGTVRMEMGWTPAHAAAESGKLNALRALQASGVPLYKTDKYGDTPLRLAEVYGHVDCIHYLQQVEKEHTEKREIAVQSEPESENDEDKGDKEGDDDDDFDGDTTPENERV